MTPVPSARIQHLLKRLALASCLTGLALAILTYGADYAVFRYRAAGNHQPFGQITVTPYDAVQQKNGKTEFLFDPPQAQTCVHALFPHSGYKPCWYLQRHTEPRTNI